MAQVYDRPQLAYRFVWFYQILRRTDTMSEEDKQIIEKELRMQFNYRELVKDDPVIQELFAEREAEGRAEGKIEGLQEAALNVLHMRFPVLATIPQVQQAIACIQDAKELTVLHRALFLASDEQEARKLLKLPAQGDLL
jgi:predicted transposase YdaD